jgi:4-aminobutyrate aminotransferase/(S)-3-amino-2-methylpropionate transaminase
MYVQSSPPDIVTFSKKLQAAGFYHRPEMRPNLGYRNFNTWLGDPLRALQLQVIAQAIKDEQLLTTVTQTGAYLEKCLNVLSEKYPSISNVRGVGTLLAFDLPTAAIRDALVSEMRQSGVQISGCGTLSIRLRPMLIFAPRHALQLVSRLALVAEKLKL